MIVVVVFAVLFLTFFFMRKHAGPALLAAAAGGLLNGLLNRDLTRFCAEILNGVPQGLISSFICLFFVLVLPMMLYFRGNRGVGKVSRVLQSVALALLIVVLIIDPIEKIFILDEMSKVLVAILADLSKYVIITGIVLAYADILMYKESGD